MTKDEIIGVYSCSVALPAFTDLIKMIINTAVAIETVVH